jgi:nucleotide-binding universal stress UspA family protein
MMLTSDETAPPTASSAPDTVEHAVPFVARIVVPVDGSPFAERALPVAAWLAEEVGAPLHLVQVVARPSGAERAVHYLDDLARRYDAAGWNATQGDDPAAAIVAATHADRHRPGLACLATHGRDRSAALLGSVATSVLDRATEPVMVVGPEARPPCAADAPVVVAVDGSPEDRAVVGIAADWAATLGRRLVVVTVAGPMPGSFERGRPLHRVRRPDDAERYVAGLATGVDRPGCAVESLVVHDPISVRGGLLRLIDRTAGMLVIGAHRHTRPLRALVGSHAARIVHDIEVPAVVVPLGTGD